MLVPSFPHSYILMESVIEYHRVLWKSWKIGSSTTRFLNTTTTFAIPEWIISVKCSILPIPVRIIRLTVIVCTNKWWSTQSTTSTTRTLIWIIVFGYSSYKTPDVFMRATMCQTNTICIFAINVITNLCILPPFLCPPLQHFDSLYLLASLPNHQLVQQLINSHLNPLA